MCGYNMVTFTRILKHVGLDIELKESVDNSVKIRRHNLGQMPLEDKKGVLVKKGSKATKKGSQSQQASSQKQARQ